MKKYGAKTLIKTAVFTLPLLAAGTPALANAQGCSEARNFVTTVSARISGALAAKTGRKEKFAGVFRQYADLRGMANFALGRYQRQMPKAKRGEYYRLAEKMVVHMLTSRMGSVRGRSYQIWRCRPTGAGYTINGAIIEANGSQVITVNWLLKPRNKRLKVADLSVAHLWMTQQQRSSFRKVMSKNNGNIEALFAHIRKKSS